MYSNRKTILFIAGAKPTYPRNSGILELLRKNYDVIEITSPASSYIFRFPIVFLKFLFRRRRHFDAIFVSWMGHPIVPFLKIFSRKPIVFDAFLSLFDSICLERRKYKPSSFQGRLIFWLDKISCKLASIVVIDTNTHAAWFTKTFGIPRKKIKTFYICADVNFFTDKEEEMTDDLFVVEFHGGFIPLQGVPVILQAAKILSTHKDIVFRFLGNGPELSQMKKMTDEMHLVNVEFFEKFVPLTEVADFIQKSNVALGIFGLMGKTYRVIPNKAYEGMATRRAVVTVDSPAAREILTNGKDSLLSKPGDPKDLSEKILRLKNDPKLRAKIAEEGYNTFKRVCDPELRLGQINDFINEAISIHENRS
ncbi:MAG: glycosyl transferase family 1 [Candidatus Harrisonbacteria bacterium CG10_big_fil_rev_8_21_14_0_10_40_38]|uniref:Glycosyl transferase family 1 n=1 Tax=Candidatus Harrisonbacteria bacterium CG10_big_fil_rev_8_21_14_0_10_40_38 TaxID=1974583 RepID=A0A2H0UR75_9BACT|nr:MAG: glycosyl transferase family 1 [Candidatus Harrisonbacteria bacterium CG10_big_fil_rev_8_21_14_0_10_40_38]